MQCNARLYLYLTWIWKPQQATQVFRDSIPQLKKNKIMMEIKYLIISISRSETEHKPGHRELKWNYLEIHIINVNETKQHELKAACLIILHNGLSRGLPNLFFFGITIKSTFSVSSSLPFVCFGKELSTGPWEGKLVRQPQRKYVCAR